MTKRLFLLALLCLLAFSLRAQHSVRGSVSDAQTGESVAFANCVVLRQSDSLFVRGTTTDPDGHFRIDSLAAGDYLLRVSLIGYATLYQPLDGQKELHLALVPEATRLGEVNITADRPLYSADGEKTLYHVSDDPSVQTGTAMDVLQNAPGVEVDAAGTIRLRGNSQVEVWINDRPSHLDDETLKQYLKTMTASNIKRVEVITNPSARYGSSASAIINIITQQRMVRNELLCLGMNAATTPTLTPWLSYVWANDRVSVNAWLSGSYGGFDISVEEHRTLRDNDGNVSTDYGLNGQARQQNANANAGVSIDWMLDTNTTLSLWAGGYPSGQNEESHYDVLRTEHIYAPGNYNYASTINNLLRFQGYNGGAYLEHRMDTLGQRIELTLNSNYARNNQTCDKERLYEVQHQLDVLNHIGQPSYSSWTNLDLNYVKPYSSTGEVELGGGAVLGRNRSDRQWDTLDHVANQLLRDADRTYSRRDRDNEVSLFATVQQRFGQLVLKGGARVYRKWKHAEYTELPTPTTEYDVHKARWDFIPSLHASYGTPSGHNFTFSYTRRFSSPGASLWSPYVELYEDSYIVGNPDLRFSHTHNLEGGWAWYQAWGSLGLSGFLNANTDEMGVLSDVAYLPYFGRVVEFSQYQNIGSSSTEGVSANLMLRPKSFFNVRIYANLYDYRYRFEYRPNEWQDTSMLTFSARLNVWAKLWNKLQVFANANYRSRSLRLMSTSAPNFSLDLGLSADLLDNRLSLYLNVDDLLQSKRFGTANINPYYTSDYSYHYNSRSISLGFTYRLGKMELESRARKGGNDVGPM